MQTTTPTVLEVSGVQNSDLLARVLAYSNPEFIERLKDKLDIVHEEAEILFIDMKRFLYLCSIGEGSCSWTPPAQIDAAWHEFILYTEEYSAFCKEMFGRIMHHVPHSYLGAKTNGRKWDTNDTAQTMFGVLSKNWDLKGCCGGRLCSGC